MALSRLGLVLIAHIVGLDHHLVERFLSLVRWRPLVAKASLYKVLLGVVEVHLQP